MTFIFTMLLAPLVAALGSDDFARRETAQKFLELLSLAAWPALERAKASADPEVAFRADLVQQRCWTPYRVVAQTTVKQPGWCSPEMAAWYAADQARWSRLGPMLRAVGGYCPAPDGTLYVPAGLTDVQYIAAVINYARSQWRRDGVLDWQQTWQAWAYPQNLALGPDLPVGP